ncbi:MAG TPA: polymer-forming cytoskeletal protein [Pyrinomonadaceae bacterium]|nr:polymer-forming cytoskeletal protein [Pyrinomonadaceae bacterium]
MFRVGKSKTDAPEQPKPAPAQPPAPQQSQTAQQQPTQPARPQPAPAMATPEARPAQAAPTQQGTAATPQPQQRAQVEQQALTSRAVSESEALARSLKEGAVGGFVGGTSTLSGEINFRGMMRVDGKVTGRVASDDGTLIVSSGGRVEAEVFVAVAKISGEVTGDITAAERVELGRTARVSGNIQTPALVVEDGAIFEGNCRMSRQREGGEAARSRSKTAA